MAENDPPTSLSSGKVASRSEVSDFLAKVARTPLASSPGNVCRLLFAMDATASRRPMWDRACAIQAEMFDAAAELGGIRDANQGVFVILPRDDVPGSSEQAQIFKTVRVVSTITYSLEN